jgi:hypothetical protein
MIGNRFIQFNPNENSKSKFEQMLDVFMQLLTYTNGDASEALSWMNELDKKYQFTTNDYGMGDFIQDLKDNGYINENPADGSINITGKVSKQFAKKVWKKFLENSKKQSKAIIKHLNMDKEMK